MGHRGDKYDRMGPGHPSERPNPLSEVQQAFLRGELAHEWMDPNETFQEGTPTIAQWAEDWQVDIKEARRRWTRMRVQQHRDKDRERRRRRE
tara:strand:- start:1717 stop:1992 length:276 start_codon:yes stop_codon:yes gene_type:complete